MEHPSTDLKQVLSPFIKNPYTPVFSQSVIILIPLILMSLGMFSAFQLFVNDLSKDYSVFFIAKAFPFCFVILFILLFLYSVFSSIKRNKSENQRYEKYINDSDIVEEWAKLTHTLYTQDTTQICESENYIFIFESDAQGPFIFNKRKLEYFKVTILRPKRSFRSIGIELAFKIKDEKGIYYILEDKDINDLGSYETDSLFLSMKSMIVYASRFDINISKGSNTIKYIPEITKFLRK